MVQSKRVALVYGNSILLEGLAETLRARGDLIVVALNLLADGSALIETHPDLVLVDALQTTPNQLEALIAVFPVEHSPAIIRLNADSKSLTIVSARQFPAASLNDLAQALATI